MKDIISATIKTQLDTDKIRDRLISYLVKKGRGTYQALEECLKIEQELGDSISEYVYAWLLEELSQGSLRKKIIEEYNTQLIVELSRRGFDRVL